MPDNDTSSERVDIFILFIYSFEMILGGGI